MIKSSNHDIRHDHSSYGSTLCTEGGNGYASSSAAAVAKTSLRPPKYFRVKYHFERLIALILLIPALPVVAVLACLVRATSRGPAIYRQTRVGLDGQEFSMLKIRTMAVDAESESGPTWCKKSDPRVTGVGKWLRFLHLDELPQLINVIKGEMAIIGPRPERPEFVRVFNESIGDYSDRLKIKPGITGLAQIYLPPDETIDCVRKKIRFDRSYIETANPMVDVKIWLCTLVRIIGVRNGRGPKWFGLDRQYQDLFAMNNSDIESEPTSREIFSSVPQPILSEAVCNAISPESKHSSDQFRFDPAKDSSESLSGHSLVTARNRKAK